MLIWAKSSTLKSRLGLWPPSYPATHRPTLPPIHHLHVPPLPATCHLPAQLNLAKPNLYFPFQLQTQAWQRKGQGESYIWHKFQALWSERHFYFKWRVHLTPTTCPLRSLTQFQSPTETNPNRIQNQIWPNTEMAQPHHLLDETKAYNYLQWTLFHLNNSTAS